MSIVDYEIITIHEYFGNNFSRSRQAKLYSNGLIEYLPEPEYEDTPDEEKDEEECMMTSWTRSIYFFTT